MSLASLDDSSSSRATEETVLVVESDAIVRSVIANYLRACEYKVIEAANADEALAVLRHTNMFIDVLLSAVEIQGSIGGATLAEWVRARRPEIEIVLAPTMPDAAEAAGTLCAQGPAMRKPREAQAVIDKINQLLASRVS